MSRVNRYDRIPIGATRRQDGFIFVEGSKIARTGVQEYRRADGSIVKELRVPGEVFNEASMKSFALVPLTNTHPTVMLSSDNAKQYAVGAVGEATKLDGKWLTAPLNVWDAEAIKAIESGRVQLSAGYSCELVDESGEWEGEHYDCKQTNIVANHIALVDFARAGNEARLKLDANDAESIVEDSKDKPVSVKHKEIRPMAQVKIDGLSFQVQDENMQAVIDRALSERDQKIAAATKRADDADAARAEAEKKRSEAQAKLDAEIERATADAEKMMKCDECGGVGSKECKGCDGKGEYAKKMDTAERRKAMIDRLVEKRAHERSVLVSEARRHLGANEKLDGKTDIEIKRAIVLKLSPKTKLDGKDDAYVSARYDAAIENVGTVTAIDSVRTIPALVPPVVTNTDDKPTDAEEAKRRSDDRYRTAHYKVKK